jgi:hypothetical protein
MRGCVAIWHQGRRQTSDDGPKIELHVNMWRGARSHGHDRIDLLDVGLMFLDVRGLRSLSIAIPIRIPQERFSCLFELLKDTTTLSAIFNETFRRGNIDELTDSFPTFLGEATSASFHVANACIGRDFDLEESGSPSDPCTIVTLKQAFFERNAKSDGSFYVRLRVELRDLDWERFSTVIVPEDRAFLSSIFLTEAVEFRLNERRNLGAI